MTTPTTVNVRLQLRADTAANWTAANPILLANEVGLETDTKKLKVGDGTTAWASLAYFPSIVTGGTVLGNLEIGSTGTLTFEGSTADGFETTLAVTDPTADRTITLPDQSGTVVVTGNASIVDADIAAGAEIAVSKLANGTANQVLVTDGTDVSWSDDLTLAGNLTVNGTTTTVNTETLVVEDKNIELGVVGTPTDTTANGGGITLKGTTDKTINWIDATDAWTSSERFSVPLGSAASPSLTFTGDENTGIYSPGADQLALSTNGTGRLFVDSAGLVGIGTSSPAALLHLSSATGSATPTPTELRIATTSNASDWSSTDPWGRISFYSADGSNSGPKTHWAIDTTSRDVFGGLSDFQIKRNEGSGLLSTLSISALGTTTLTSGSSQEPLIVKIDTNEAARIDSSGRLLVGTSSSLATVNNFGTTLNPSLQQASTNSNGASQGIYFYGTSGNAGPTIALSRSNATEVGGHVIIGGAARMGGITFNGSDGTKFVSGAEIYAANDGTPGADDMPGRLVFSTTADGASSPTERMRIGSDGSVFINKTLDNNTTSGFRFNSNNEASFVRDSGTALILDRLGNDGGVAILRRGNTTVGSISVTSTTTTYNTSSDYRLKENVTPVTDGITRLQQLKPSRFNFIADPDKTVDGFLAHEVQTIVPEAITGEKDAVDDEGNPVYQGIDQSKLVPLLTAALQEAIAKIETLEQRLNDAGIN